MSKRCTLIFDRKLRSKEGKSLLRKLAQIDTYRG